jgi:TRAP-type C4-dicarboxylate transport system substrate-binding protein
VIAGGATVIEVADRGPWQALMEPVYAKYASAPRMADLLKRIRETR